MDVLVIGGGPAGMMAAITAAEHGDKVFLEVEFDNDPALALYDKTGFQRYGMRKDYYGPGMDAVLMCKNL